MQKPSANHKRRDILFVSLEDACVSEGGTQDLKHVISQETGGQVQFLKAITTKENKTHTNITLICFSHTETLRNSNLAILTMLMTVHCSFKTVFLCVSGCFSHGTNNGITVSM